MYPRFKPTSFLFALTLLGATLGVMAQEPADLPESAEQDQSYRLVFRDLVRVTVFGEGDLGVEQRVDGNGAIRLGLLGNLKIAGMTLREAERAIEEAYVREAYLRDPQVTIQIVEYSVKEVSVFGHVGRPGPVVFPHERNSMDIVELISRVGGFSPSARSDRVQITRHDEEGKEVVSEVDVDRLISGGRRRGSNPNRETFAIYPGDIIFVPERIW